MKLDQLSAVSFVCVLLCLALAPNSVLAVCGDVNSSGSLAVNDLVYGIAWLSGSGAAPSDFAQADADDYANFTVRDLAHILNFLFSGGPAPVCPPTNPKFAPAPNPNLNVSYSTVFPASTTTFAIDINFSNAVAIVPSGYCLPFTVKVDGVSPATLAFTADGNWPSAPNGIIDIGGTTGTLLILGYYPLNVSANTWKMGTLTITMASSSPVARTISLTYTALPPLQGGLPVNEPLMSNSTPTKDAAVAIEATVPFVNGKSPCGDADGNGLLTISDAVFLINYIFSGGPAPGLLIFGDADCSKIINISDAVYLINYIFMGGSAPCATCL